MPEVAANTADAILSGWPLAENTAFAAGDAIAIVETEKAVVDVPADSAGVILKLLVAAGSEVGVGDPIALLGDVGEPVGDLNALLAELGAVLNGKSHAGSGALQAEPVPAKPAVAEPAVGEPLVPHAVDNGGRIFSSPLARRLAKAAGITLAELSGTGQGGRVVRRDVDHAVELRSQQPQPIPSSGEAATSASYADIPHTRMRRAIASRLADSAREAPHFYVNGTARVDKLIALRAKANVGREQRISLNDMVLMAAARAHVLLPAMNVIWMPDAVRSFSQVDISLAVATDRGLVTPVVRGVDQLTLAAITAATGDLVGRARSGSLRQEELVGGSLTVTNLGGYGTAGFSAIINPPQSAILAVGAAKSQPVVSKGRLRVGTLMNVTLSVDHRPIDGVVAAQWMAEFISLLEAPVRILL